MDRGATRAIDGHARNADEKLRCGQIRSTGKQQCVALAPGDTLLFPCGTYLTTSQLLISVSSVTIDGSGCATIHDAGSGTSAVLVIGANETTMPSYGPAVALSATANELATSFTTVSSLGVGPGDYVYIHQG